MNPDAEKIPTLALLAGTTSVYCAQFEFAGAPLGQAVLLETEMRPVESTSAVVFVAGMVCSGIVTCSVVAGPFGTACSAERLTSIVPAGSAGETAGAKNGSFSIGLGESKMNVEASRVSVAAACQAPRFFIIWISSSSTGLSRTLWAKPFKSALMSALASAR